jgi:type II secretory pathway component GspD/PulD (secretin)
VGSKDLGVGLDSTGLIVNQSIPVIGHRIVNNTSIVENGKTLALAGLLDNQKSVTTTAPPLLSDIPWVGFLFTQTTEEAIQTELMIYITPTVIDNPEQLRTVTQAEIQKLRNYDMKTKGTIDQMLTGKKMKADDTFKLYDYFSDKKYRQNQSFIPEPENL